MAQVFSDESRPLVLRPGVSWDPVTKRAGPANGGLFAGASAPAVAPNAWANAGILTGERPKTDEGPVFGPPAPLAAPKAAADAAAKGATTETKPDQGAAKPMAVPQWNLPDSVMKALAEKNMVPQAAGTQQGTPAELMDSKNVKALAAYDYTLSDNEWASLQQMYGKQTGDKAAAPVVRSGKVESQEMSRKAYDALTTDQRNAVDFNTLLVAAREKDLVSQPPTLTGDDLKKYTESVNTLFGPDGGAVIAAPHVVKLLESVKYSGKGQDLDQFLSLDAAVTADQLKDFKLPPMPIIKAATETQAKGAPIESLGWPNLGILKGPNQTDAEVAAGEPAVGMTPENFGKVRSADNQALATGLAIRNVGELINTAMKNAANRTSEPLSAARSQIGIPDAPKVGWSIEKNKSALSPKEQEKQGMFFQAYQHLADPATKDMSTFWRGVQARGWSEDTIDELFNFVDDYSRYEERTGQTHEGVRSSADIRKFAGLGEK